MFSIFKRPFGSPNAVIYSYELSKRFLDDSVTSILEVGCGIGIFATRYASSRKYVSIVGIDHSSTTIDFLSSHYVKYYKNLQLKSCDFCEKGLYLGNTFGAVYSSDVFEHVTDTQAFVDNTYRHLLTGGKAVINLTTHGINHFAEVRDVQKLFGAFSNVRVFLISIDHPVEKLWFATRSLYERLFSRSTRNTRMQLYSEREEQGIDCFEDSTCFKFVSKKGWVVPFLASIFAELVLMIKPAIDIHEIESGTILNSPRLIGEFSARPRSMSVQA